VSWMEKDKRSLEVLEDLGRSEDGRLGQDHYLPFLEWWLGKLQPSCEGALVKLAAFGRMMPIMS
jgi:hypothetical protein